MLLSSTVASGVYSPLHDEHGLPRKSCRVSLKRITSHGACRCWRPSFPSISGSATGKAIVWEPSGLGEEGVAQGVMVMAVLGVGDAQELASQCGLTNHPLGKNRDFRRHDGRRWQNVTFFIGIVPFIGDSGVAESTQTPGVKEKRVILRKLLL